MRYLPGRVSVESKIAANHSGRISAERICGRERFPVSSSTRMAGESGGRKVSRVVSSQCDETSKVAGPFAECVQRARQFRGTTRHSGRNANRKPFGKAGVERRANPCGVGSMGTSQDTKSRLA